MSQLYMPIIAADEYEGVKAILGEEMMLSYDDWLKLSYAYWHPDHHQGKATPVPVDIEAEGLARYLASHPEHRNIRGLLAYAEAKATTRS